MKIEGEEVAAIEMTQALDDLLQSLKTRVDSQFLSSAVLDEINQVNDADPGHVIDKETVLQTAISFYQACVDYLDQWKLQFEDVLIFGWATLTTVPNWNEVEATIKFLVENNWMSAEEKMNVELFDEFGFVKRFVTTDKIRAWNENHTKPHQRWVECFQHFENNHVLYKRFARVIEFIFCLPATSASVERVFSLITKIWTAEKSQLGIETLRNILFVKFNLKYECVDFYNFLKESPSLLKQISSQDKYDFKK